MAPICATHRDIFLWLSGGTPQLSKGDVLQGTYKTRHARALFLVVVMTLSLVMGALGMPAQADETTPTPTPTPTSDPTSSSDPTPSTTADPSDTGSDRALLGTLSPTAVPDAWVVRRGYTTTINVAANDNRPPADTCVYSRGSYLPGGWAMTITTAGIMTVKVPLKTKPGRYHVYYRLVCTNPAGIVTGNVQSFASIAVTPDSYSAPSGMVFTHPFRKGYRYRIRNHILRTINSVPSGARINIASWSFSSRSYYRALNQAKYRGVIVQIVLSARNKRSNSDYRTLANMFGTRVTANGNWVKRCAYSCRGTGGTMHSKIFLFSQVYRTPYVTMTGSANLTDFAVTSQWNQMNTVKNKAVYTDALAVLTQMSADRLAHPMYVEKHYEPYLWAYYYPRGAVSQSNDFMLKALAPVRCTGAVNAGKYGRTIIRIAMYAWYQDRGKWLAERVRQLWQQGCQIQIVYAISSNPVKKILYSPSGRGRIPMRQILLTNKDEMPIYYLHDKWVAITGNYAGIRNNSVSFQGSFNFSNLGFYSDENFQMLRGRANYDRFARDFTLLWKDKQARAPSPNSTILNVERTAPGSPTLGTGTYTYMEAD
jgi:hypothetical protein